MTARRNSNNYVEVKLNDEVEAWSQDDNIWLVTKNNGVDAVLNFETERRRRPDMTGQKAYRVITSHTVTATVRAGYKIEHSMQPMKFYGGEVETVKKLLEMFASGHLFQLARLDASDECIRKGATTLQQIEANDVYDWRYDKRSEFDNEKLALRQHIELLAKLEKGDQ